MRRKLLASGGSGSRRHDVRGASGLSVMPSSRIGLRVDIGEWRCWRVKPGEFWSCRGGCVGLVFAAFGWRASLCGLVELRGCWCVSSSCGDGESWGLVCVQASLVVRAVACGNQGSCTGLRDMFRVSSFSSVSIGFASGS